MLKLHSVFLARDDLRLHVVREILSDIVADDKRAADVIDRLHVLMKKENSNHSRWQRMN